MKKNYDYGYEHPLMSAFVAVGGFATIICLAAIILQVISFFVNSTPKNLTDEQKKEQEQRFDCQTVRSFYGIGTYRSQLPEGVEIKYISGSCVRTDNLTVMTGNEKY
jgi:hypothetical protein